MVTEMKSYKSKHYAEQIIKINFMLNRKERSYVLGVWRCILAIKQKWQ